MKNFVVLLMALALIGGASAQCGTGPIWGLANSSNPYEFDTDDVAFSANGVDCWDAWDGAGNDVSSTSGGLLTITSAVDGYALVFVHDNQYADLGITPGVDFIEVVVVVDSITADNAIVKIEQYGAGNSQPTAGGAGDNIDDLWDPDSTITGPGEYHFVTAAVARADLVSVTPVVGVSNGTIVIDSVWIGAEGQYPGGTKATNPFPKNNKVYPTGSIGGAATPLGGCTWDLPEPFDGVSALTVEWKFEEETCTVDGIAVYDPNWGGCGTTTKTTGGTDKVLQNFGFPTTPYGTPLPDGLYTWQVNITDPSIGGPGTTTGNIWTFKIGDAPVDVNQPANQYMYVAQEDFDGDSNIRTFTVEFDYTDDGKSPITAADVNNLNWGWNPLGDDGILGTDDDERGVEMTGVVYNPVLPATVNGTGFVTATFETKYNATDPNYSTDIMGYWDIRLEVTDGIGTELGTAGRHEIWELCGEAAAADPGDIFHPDQKNSGIYDADGDCEIGLPDFQAYAATWLEQSVLLD